MAKRRDQIETIDQAIDAYGGIAAMEREFRKVRSNKTALVNSWREAGEVPRGHHLGLYLGLRELGHDPAPKLFGVDRWTSLPGWPRPRKLPKRASRKR